MPDIRLFKCDDKWIVDASNISCYEHTQLFLEFNYLDKAKEKIIELLRMLED